MIKTIRFKKGKFKHLVKQLDFFMEKEQQQRGKNTIFPVETFLKDIFFFEVPNYVGVKKITITFDYKNYSIFEHWRKQK